MSDRTSGNLFGQLMKRAHKRRDVTMASDVIAETRGLDFCDEEYLWVEGIRAWLVEAGLATVTKDAWGDEDLECKALPDADEVE